jgi:hypothetical protein
MEAVMVWCSPSLVLRKMCGELSKFFHVNSRVFHVNTSHSPVRLAVLEEGATEPVSLAGQETTRREPAAST